MCFLLFCFVFYFFVGGGFSVGAWVGRSGGIITEAINPHYKDAGGQLGMIVKRVHIFFVVCCFFKVLPSG